jgi:hypothetical protein
MAHPGTIIKPSIGFQARFFWKGLDRRLCLKGKGLGREKARKNEKTLKKVKNNFGGTPVFLQKAPVFQPETNLDKTHNL